MPGFDRYGVDMNLSRRAPEVQLSNAGYLDAQDESVTSHDSHRLSSAVDVWSLGMLFYHVLTGHFSPYGAPSETLPLFEENRRIIAGEFDLSPLENAGELYQMMETKVCT